MPENDLALLTEAAEAGGAEALRFWRNNPTVWEKPGGAGPVSVADLAVNAVLAERLRGARPAYGWLSEEDEEQVPALDGRSFVVDPIDGTRAFLAGDEIFAVALAVVENGRVVAGVVHLPARRKTYAASAGGAATLNGKRITAGGWSGGGVPKVLTSGQVMKPENWPGGVPEVERSFRPALAYRLCLVAEGRMDAMLTLRPAWEWDIAAGALIAERAGAVVSDQHGAPLAFGGQPPQAPGVLVAREGLHADLLARLRG